MPRKEFQLNVSNFNDSVSPSKDIPSYKCELLSGIVNSSDPKKILKSLRLKNINRLIWVHLNIIYVRNMFDFLVNITNNNIDILMISKTKLNSSFPVGQSFSFIGFPSHIDLTVLVTEVEFYNISVKTFVQNL